MEQEIKWANRVELAKVLSEKLKQPSWRIFKIINTVFKEMKNKLLKDGRIEIRGFGVFRVKIRKGRTYLNPKSKAVIVVKDRKTVTFKPSKLFLKTLRNA